MCGWGDLLATQFYNERLRAYRRPIHALVGTKTGVLRYNDLQEVEVHRFLLRVLNKPADLLDHIRTYDHLHQPFLAHKEDMAELR
jgi:hypothetical protein